MEAKTDIKKTENSLSVLHTYFCKENIKGQAEVKLPKSIKLYSIDHYRYLFYSCLLNYGMKSSLLHENLIHLYNCLPDLFLPRYVVENYSNDYINLADLLRSYIHVRYPNECAKRWVGLSAILHVQYHDNPMEMFKNKSTYNEFKQAISQVKGLGQKTGGLLLRMLIDSGMLESCDGIAEIPIDRHDVDLCIWLEIISGFTADEIKKNKKIIKMLSDTWVQAANNLSISPSLADQYLWIIGSQYCTTKNCNQCPIQTLCKREDLIANEENIYCGTNV